MYTFSVACIIHVCGEFIQEWISYRLQVSKAESSWQQSSIHFSGNFPFASMMFDLGQFTWQNCYSGPLWNQGSLWHKRISPAPISYFRLKRSADSGREVNILHCYHFHTILCSHLKSAPLVPIPIWFYLLSDLYHCLASCGKSRSCLSSTDWSGCLLQHTVSQID